MSSYKPTKQFDEDSPSEGIGEGELLDEDQGFFNSSYREEDSSSSALHSHNNHHQTWSPFEDLNDSGHFTASPDGETALSGSSRSHSPCLLSPATLGTIDTSFQMHQHNSVNSQAHNDNYQFYQQQIPQLNKPLNAPRSVMTVKVPALSSDGNNSSFRNSEQSTNHSFVMGSCTNHEIETPKLLTREFSQTSANGHHESRGEGETCEESSEYLRGILDNFNSLYMEKLRMLDDLVAEGNEEQRMLMMEKKTNMLETWAKDVCVQNMVLVHTVEELEKEANRKVSALQKKITESTQAAKEHMTMIKKYEEQVKLLLKNHSDTEEKNLVLKIDLEKLKNECKRVKDRMNFLMKDNESLITLVCRIRDMGVWDVNGLELQRSSFDQIFGLYPNLVGGEVQTVFTREKAKRVQDTEEKVSQLERKLVSVQQTQRETESQLANKDRKIEELETEIKNLSNRAQYCEKECNDYKKSLLETQEKLLEATRRLNSTPKLTKPPPVPGVSEMTELIRELREVKSQLNTAVEEKHTAKEESNYFKRELSDRLREMHDIQNIFQSLATEVVSSRAAFQQVQEKEVQLQSLKSEVQTYQTRCADAEDTIRKKEKEIKHLQKQMNEIHKRSKKPSNPVSSNSLHTTSENGESRGGRLGFYEMNLRNVSSPPKQPVRKPVNKVTRYKSQEPIRTKPNEKGDSAIPQQRAASQANIQGGRPVWNKNFKKSTGILSRPAAQLPKVTNKCSVSNNTRSQASFPITSQFEETDEGIENVSQSCKEVYSKLTELGERLSSEQMLCSTLENRNSSTLGSTQAKESFANLFKLPKIQDKAEDEEKINSCDPVEIKEAAVAEKRKLPVVRENSIGISKRKGPSKKLDNPLFKKLGKNPRTTTPRLNELISAVVETSKQLLGSDAEELSVSQQNKDIKSVTITAAHYRKKPLNKQKMEARRVKSSDQNAEMNRGASAEEPAPIIPTKFHSSTGIGGQDNAEEPVEKVSYELPENVQEFLAGLPQASNDDLVKSWIERSSNSNNRGKMKRVHKQKTPVVSGRRPSVKVMKHLATRRWPKKSSRESVNQAEELNAEMFELEDEWGKVFANLECNMDGAIKGKDKVEKAVGSTSSSPLQPPVTHPNSSIPSCSEEFSMRNSSEQANTEKKCQQQQQESIQELLDRLSKEKKEMEERFRKELQDRDIELKMQKVTIQHLQDAYVALKRGQPIPVPQHVTGNKFVVNGASANGHHHNQVLDV